MRLLIATFVCILAFVVAATFAQSMAGLHVVGNKIYNNQGQVVRLRGIDHSGSEYMCIQGQGIFDGPTSQLAINAMKTWKINAVRLPLNEDCWLGINGVHQAFSGYSYQRAIVDYVQRLNSNNLAVILDLHWTAPGSTLSSGQQPMPDMDHAPTFWRSVASAFKNNSYVIFDLFNEPYPGSNAWDSTAAWNCWKNGGSCPGIGYQVAGMQTLVDAVRSTGATNILMLGGISYSNSLTRWLDYMPTDPHNALAASWHSYNFNHCNYQNCWENVIKPVGEKVPLITGELGENDCSTGYILPLLQWLDQNQFSYLAWTWNTWNCNSGPALITNYDGSPTGYGIGYQHHLAHLNA